MWKEDFVIYLLLMSETDLTLSKIKGIEISITKH